MTTRNLNAVTLVRVSTKKQGGEDRFGMEAQRTSNARIVAEHCFTVRKTVEYSDVSGDAVMFTPEMQELQEFLRTPAMKGGNLVAKELSRLLRPNFNSYPLLQVFVEQRISIHLPQYVLQLWTPEGRMLAGVMCANDFNEAERIRDRCMGGREESRRLGYCAAGGRTVPTGVTWDVKTKTWGYDDIYAPKVAKAFEMVANGETNFQHIIDTLQLYLRPDHGTAKLATPTALRRLLENPLFIGERVWDKKFDMSVPKESLLYMGKDGKLHKRNRPMIAREPHETYRIRVINPGLVRREVFEKVQTILRAKSDKVHQSHMLHQDKEKFAYRGLLFCAECGQPLYTVYTSGHAYYRCRDHFVRRGGTFKCASRGIRRDLIEAEIECVLSREFTKTRFLSLLLQKQLASESRAEVARRRKRLMAQHDALDAKRARVIEFALDGTISKADRDRRLKVVDDDLQLNQQALAALVESPMPTQREWNELMRPFRRGFAGLPVEEKRRMVAERFQEIKVRDGKVVSLYLLTGETKAVAELPAVSREHTNCHTCGQVLSENDLDYNLKCEVDASWRFCQTCLDSPRERAERQYRLYGYERIPQVSSVSDSSLRLWPLRFTPMDSKKSV